MKFHDKGGQDMSQYDQRYYDLLAYILSNTVAGELMAVDNYTEMVPLLENTERKIETVKQASDEAKHVQLLSKLGQRLHVPVMQRIIEPQWLAIRNHFSESAKRGDLASCLITQDLMVETLAIVLYRTLGRHTDPATTATANNILQDELRHLQIGIDRIKALMDEDPAHVHECLALSHDRVMPELFSFISYSCESLCGDLGVECATLGLDSIQTDLEDVKIEAMDTYMEMLDRVDFDPQVTAPLFAKMSEYGERPRVDLSLRSCCAPTE